jgi:hypothetical protein
MEELVTVAAYSQAMKAEVAKNFLEDNGVRAFIADENSALTTWNNLVETKVQVAAADADRARALLAEQHDAEDLVDDE